MAKPRVSFPLRLPPELYKKIELKKRREEKKSMNELIIELILKGLGGEKKV